MDAVMETFTHTHTHTHTHKSKSKNLSGLGGITTSKETYSREIIYVSGMLQMNAEDGSVG